MERRKRIGFRIVIAAPPKKSSSKVVYPIINESVKNILAHLPKINVARLAGARKNCSKVPDSCSFLTLWPTPHTDVLNSTMKTKPKKKEATLGLITFPAADATGAKSVTPNATKKNQRGVLTNSPTTQAG